MTATIICVKIAQRILYSSKQTLFNTFPFDRIYLAEKQYEPQVSNIFRYYITFPLDFTLYETLRLMHPASLNEIRVARNDKALIGEKTTKDYEFEAYVDNYEDWTVIVPTHVKTNYVDGVPQKTELAYILTKAIDYGSNTRTRLPTMTLVTPTRRVPIMCAICSSVLNMQAGNCVPGRISCKRKAKINLPYDDYNRRKTTGEDPCP